MINPNPKVTRDHLLKLERGLVKCIEEYDQDEKVYMNGVGAEKAATSKVDLEIVRLALTALADQDHNGDWWRKACLKWLAVESGSMDSTAVMTDAESLAMSREYGGTPSMIIGAAVALGKRLASTALADDAVTVEGWVTMRVMDGRAFSDSVHSFTVQDAHDALMVPVTVKMIRKRADPNAGMTDTERLDWLEKMADEGNSPNLVFDDDGHWAVSFCGSQPCPRGGGLGFDEPVDIGVSVDPEEWQPSIREAIDYAIEHRK